MQENLAAAQALFTSIPREKLGFFPTPFYKLENLSAQLGVNLYIKRDDFTGMNLFGGNKVRKLEFLLGAAKAAGCEYVITYGATQSNHAMETAACCRRCGLKPILYLTAVVTPDAADVRSNLLLDKILDAEIHIVEIKPGETEEDAEARSFTLGAARAAGLNAAGHPCMDVPMGGANAVGSLGFAAGYLELAQQLEEAGIAADAIYHATGTGGTLAGMLAGRKLMGDTTPIVSVQVSAKDPVLYPKKVAKLATDVLASLGSNEVVAPDEIQLEPGYYLPGYEQPNPQASQAIRTLAVTEGLFVDPVYTGKGMAGLLGQVKAEKWQPGSNLVFWHTGGATALFAEQAILGRLYE